MDRYSPCSFLIVLLGYGQQQQPQQGQGYGGYGGYPQQQQQGYGTIILASTFDTVSWFLVGYGGQQQMGGAPRRDARPDVGVSPSTTVWVGNLAPTVYFFPDRSFVGSRSPQVARFFYHIGLTAICSSILALLALFVRSSSFARRSSPLVVLPSFLPVSELLFVLRIVLLCAITRSRMPLGPTMP